MNEKEANKLAELLDRFLTEMEALAAVTGQDEIKLLKKSISALIEVYRYGL